MSFSKVVIEKMAYSLPPNIVRSEELEESLSPLYDRLNLNIGRLELFNYFSNFIKLCSEVFHGSCPT